MHIWVTNYRIKYQSQEHIQQYCGLLVTVLVQIGLVDDVATTDYEK